MRGPLHVQIAFYLPRPKTLPKRVVLPTKKPDVDKLARFAVDALIGSRHQRRLAGSSTLHALKRYVAEAAMRHAPGHYHHHATRWRLAAAEDLCLPQAERRRACEDDPLLREGFSACCATLIEEPSLGSRERAPIALTNLEQAATWANKAVVFGDPDSVVDNA